MIRTSGQKVIHDTQFDHHGVLGGAAYQAMIDLPKALERAVALEAEVERLRASQGEEGKP